MSDHSADYHDLALVIAWPEQTARGDERWMAFFKRLGIVKNLNFKVGHAAIILIHRQTGELAYFDFGRYVTPRGYGRARSANTDPRLLFKQKAQIDPTSGEITNLTDIIRELKALDEATHGAKSIYFSIARHLSYQKGCAYAQSVIAQGVIPYGAIAPKNNSCSRYVAQILLSALRPQHATRRDIYWPESIKASPMSNVVNASKQRIIYCFEQHVLRQLYMNRYQSLYFQVSLLCHNIFPQKAAFLPSDRQSGYLIEPIRPTTVPAHAQWLGGIGEGVWYALRLESANTYRVTRYNSKGQVDYQVQCRSDEQIDPKAGFQFTYHCQYGNYLLRSQQGEVALKALEKGQLQFSE